jgi:hypothetical protein
MSWRLPSLVLVGFGAAPPPEHNISRRKSNLYLLRIIMLKQWKCTLPQATLSITRAV